MPRWALHARVSTSALLVGPSLENSDGPGLPWSGRSRCSRGIVTRLAIELSVAIRARCRSRSRRREGSDRSHHHRSARTVRRVGDFAGRALGPTAPFLEPWRPRNRGTGHIENGNGKYRNISRSFGSDSFASRHPAIGLRSADVSFRPPFRSTLLWLASEISFLTSRHRSPRHRPDGSTPDHAD